MLVVICQALGGSARGALGPPGSDGVGSGAATTSTHEDPHEVVALALSAVRTGGLAVGVGAGHRRADALALRAVRGARAAPWRVQVRGEDAAAGAHADAVLAVLADIARRRTQPGWDVVDALRGRRSQREAAAALGVTRQAVSQRALAAGWRHEQALAPLVAELLVAAQGAARPGV